MGIPSANLVPAAPLPLTTLVLQAARRVRALHEGDLPKVEELARALHAEAAQWCVAGLLFVLRAHLAAAGALRFDLLVATSLRGAPGRGNQATFRVQVEEVSTCTEVTWAQVRLALSQESRTDSIPAPVIDFVMGSRPLQRTASDAAEGLQRSLRDATAQEAELGQAAPILLARLAEAGEQMHQVLLVCAGAHAAQRAAYQAADARRELATALRELAGVLQGGLLTRLAAVIASDVLMPADELQRAVQARALLQGGLEKAIRRTEAARVAQEALLESLEVMLGGAQQAHAPQP